jgi:hypothetical protein
MNPLPLIVSVIGLLPAAAEEGDRLVTVGGGLPGACTVNCTAVEVPPPGAGFETATGKVPALAKSLAGSVAVTTLEPTKVVARGAPAKFAVEEAMNPLPLIVSVMGLLPAAAEEGDTLVTVGTGLAVACTVKSTGDELPPPGAGLETITGKAPALARSLAGTPAMSSVRLK